MPEHHHRRLRDYVRAYSRNWKESDDPFGVKLAKAARNRGTAFLTLAGCCGHHGEPGC